MKVRSTSAILIFNMADDRYAKLDVVCRRLGVRVNRVAESEYGRTIGDLLGYANLPLPGDMQGAPAPTATDPFDKELMVLFNMDNSVMSQFLQACRKQEVVVPLKAMLTPYNMAWKPAELCTELLKEHEAMRQAGADVADI